MKKIFGSESWRLASDKVEAFITKSGHLGPVTFQLPRQRIQPYAIAPWAEEKLPVGSPAVLNALRGDFFCMPFGANARSWRGEQHPLHGEPAGGAWRIESARRTAGGAEFVAVLRPRVRPGLIRKRLSLVDGQTVVYRFKRELSPGSLAAARQGLSGRSKFVWLADHWQDYFEAVPVQAGIATLERVEVLSGLAKDEQVSLEDPSRKRVEKEDDNF